MGQIRTGRSGGYSTSGGGNIRRRTEVRSLVKEYIRKVPVDKGFFQNSVTLDMWKPWIRSAGHTTPPARTASDIPSTRFSISTTL